MPPAERKEPGHAYGIHRVLDAKRRLPQAADKLDNSLPIFSNEILLSVERLNIDAASFVQMEKETGGDPEAISRIVVASNPRSRNDWSATSKIRARVSSLFPLAFSTLNMFNL